MQDPLIHFTACWFAEHGQNEVPSWVDWKKGRRYSQNPFLLQPLIHPGREGGICSSGDSGDLQIHRSGCPWANSQTCLHLSFIIYKIMIVIPGKYLAQDLILIKDPLTGRLSCYSYYCSNITSFFT